MSRDYTMLNFNQMCLLGKQFDYNNINWRFVKWLSAVRVYNYMVRSKIYRYAILIKRYKA